MGEQEGFVGYLGVVVWRLGVVGGGLSTVAGERRRYCSPSRLFWQGRGMVVGPVSTRRSRGVDSEPWFERSRSGGAGPRRAQSSVAIAGRAVGRAGLVCDGGLALPFIGKGGGDELAGG